MSSMLPEFLDARPLPKTFYWPSASVVAPRLIGHLLLRNTQAGWVGGEIVETEAYLSRNDPACHAASGRTARNLAMWGPPGHAYVYFIYGNYFCVNAVCRPDGEPEAVLIRAVEASINPEIARLNRPVAEDRSLTNGPGKLCQAMEIDKACNHADLASSESSIVILRNPRLAAWRRNNGPLVRTTRIGIREGCDLTLRFYASRSEFVSRRG